MYFIKYQPLKRKLKERTLSDREALVYLVVYIFLLGLSFALSFAIPTGATDECSDADLAAWDDEVFLLVFVCLPIAGIYYVYVANGGKSGFDLIQKYFVLGWVVGIRFLVVFLPLSVATILVSAQVLGNGCEDRIQFYPQYVVSTLGEIVYYQRLGRHIRDTRNTVIESGKREG